MIVWFTGQPGTGKTTLANELRKQGVVDFVVDGDDLRKLDNPGYDRVGRLKNVDRAQSITMYLATKGYHVAVAMVSPYYKQRRDFQERVERADIKYVEIYLTRMPARVDKEKFQYWVPDYEQPLWNELTLNTGQKGFGIPECTDMIIEVIHDAHAEEPQAEESSS